ncbi:hypothetical protein ACH474_30740 [Nocardia rhamnosiphila]|uniref:hypothetical protein n=1 Tax=Nocardia rhamnosiphila TaxID=426716 RepID=UPI0004C355AC|nr:hypothetical protein [Nocardia rhamnosiphila]
MSRAETDIVLSDQEKLLRELWAQVRGLRSEVSELRVEISEMEATLADFADRADQQERVELPWPVSLLLLPAALALALLRQVGDIAQVLAAECDSRQRAELPGEMGAKGLESGDERVSHLWETRPHARG